MGTLPSHQNFTRRGALRFAAATICGLGLAAAAPSALAEPQATQETLDKLAGAQDRFEAAQAQLAQLGSELEELGYKVDETSAQVDELGVRVDGVQGEIDVKADEIAAKENEILRTERKIAAGEAEIRIKQQRLAERMSSAYKAGPESMMSVALSSTTMEEFLSGMTYLDKVAERDRMQIEEVKGLKSSLEADEAALGAQREELNTKKDELEKKRDGLVADLEQLQYLQDQLLGQQAAVEAKQLETQNLVESLDDEVKELIAKRDAEIKAAREEEERKAREALAAQYGGAGLPKLVDGDVRGNIVRAGLSLLGTPYVWGGTWPDSGGTDCSGLCQWAYAQAGLKIPRATYTQRPACEAAGHLFYDTSLLQPGDLVFTDYGHHVTLYIGDGKVVHDPHPGAVVCIEELSNFSVVAMGFPVA